MAILKTLHFYFEALILAASQEDSTLVAKLDFFSKQSPTAILGYVSGILEAIV